MEIQGVFAMDVFRIIDGKEHLINSFEEKNLVVNGGRYQLCRLLGNKSNTVYIGYIGFGEGSDVPDVSNDSMINSYVKAIDSYTHTTPNEAKFHWTLDQDQANGRNITEYGLYTFNYTMFARKILLPVIPKTDDIIFRGTWKIVFV